MKPINFRPLIKTDYPVVANIYKEGIATGLATFETKIPDWNTWNHKYHASCRIIAEQDNKVIGYAVLSPTSNRHVYRGVAEVSVYVTEGKRGFGVGEMLLTKLVEDSEKHGFWTLQASVFSENTASINLHLKCGFRLVGIREQIGQLDGKWHNNHLLERRSTLI